jgi:ketosteroid isomerase-like protein
MSGNATNQELRHARVYFGAAIRAACCVRAQTLNGDRDTMTSSNVSRVYEYLQAVASMGPYETVADFYTADVTIQEFPNRIAPHGRVGRLSDARAAYERGREILKSQTYRVQRILEAGDELAVELEWTGILAVPVMSLPTGSEMKAFVAMFLTFRDGKIAAQRNYDCYPPFGPHVSA